MCITRNILMATIIYIASGFCFANNPCPLLGVQGEYIVEKSQCEVSQGLLKPKKIIQIDQMQLLALLINNQREQTQQIVELKVQLNTAITALNQAVTTFDQTSQKLHTENKKWKENTLNTAINSINNVSIELAKNEALQDSLTEKIKQDLLSDSSFLQKVKAQ